MKVKERVKKLFSLALAVFMVVELLPMLPAPEEVSAVGEHVHPVCGSTCSHETAHESVEWTGITSLDEITQDGNYYLLNDIELNSTHYVLYDYSLCLNGHDIIQKTQDSQIFNMTNCGLNLTDCSNRTRYGKWDDANENYVVSETEPTGDGYYDTLVGGMLTGGKSVSYGIIRVNQARTFNIYAGNIVGNIAGGSTTAYVGGMYVNGGIVHMYGGSIAGNKSSDYAGGVYLISNATFEMNGGSISNNLGGTGGIMTMGNTSTITINDGIISNNKASNEGGGISGYGAILYLNGGSIVNNTANTGGGIHLWSSSVGYINGGSIVNNTASSGGGIYISKSNFTMNAGEIKGNTAVNGGGIYSTGPGLVLNSGSIDSNTATENGGGVLYKVYDSVTSSSPYNPFKFQLKEGETISNNRAGKFGGGIYVEGNGPVLGNLECMGGIIQNNEAGEEGGGVYEAYQSKITLGYGNLTIYNNKNSTTKANSNICISEQGWGIIIDALPTLIHPIGVACAWEYYPFTDGWGAKASSQNPSDYFVADKGEAIIPVTIENNTDLALHTHEWVYTSEANKIIYDCSVAECPSENQSATLAVNAGSKAYTGSPIEGLEVQYSDNWSGSKDLAITYANNTNVGTASGSITIGDVTVTQTFDIEKATVDLGIVTNEGTSQVGPVDNNNVSLTSQYTPISGQLTLDETELVYGQHEYHYTFTPDDRDNYNDVHGIVNINVVDPTKPTGTVKIKDEGSNKEYISSELLENYSFKSFYKNNLVISIEASDSESDIKTIEYFISDAVLTQDELNDVNWIQYTDSFSYFSKQKMIVYAKITNNADNVKYISSNGFILYQDSTITTSTFRYSKKSSTGVQIPVELNRNTVKSINVDGTVIDASNYEVSVTDDGNNGTITIKGNYLDTLDTLSHTISIDYNPLGIEMSETATGHTPNTSTISLSIYLGKPNIGEVSAIGAYYEGTSSTLVRLNRADKTIPGTLTLAETTLTYGTNSYGYIFTPTDRSTYDIVTGIVTIDVKDQYDPSGMIKIKENSFNVLLNTISFGLFSKDLVDVTIEASDHEPGSGVKTIEYYISDNKLTEDELYALDAWIEYTDKFTVYANKKFCVYAKITDHDGNIAMISSNGVVVYTAAEVNESMISYMKLSGDLQAPVTLNENTIKSIRLDAEEVATDKYEVTTDGKIKLKGSYLDTLSAGNHIISVTYNPLGVEVGDRAEGDIPEPQNFELKVIAVPGSVTITNDISKVYDGQPVNAPSYEKTSSGATLIQYKLKSEAESEYTTIAPSDAGEYTVRIGVAGDGIYTDCIVEKDFTISKATITDYAVECANNVFTYDGIEKQASVTTSATTANDQEATFTYAIEENGSYTSEIPTFIEAGNHTIYYKVSAPNHNDATGSFNITINKATVNIPNIDAKDYTGNRLVADVAPSDLYEVTENAGGHEAGNYDVILTLNDDNNYKWSTSEEASVIVPFVINAVDNEWTITPAIENWTYGEEAKAPTYEARFGTVSVKYSGTTCDGTVYDSKKVPTNAGDYTVTFDVAGTASYGSLHKEVSFKVSQRSISITADNASKTYGDADPTSFTWQISEGSLHGDDQLVIATHRANGENVGTYDIIASANANDNPNYEITFVNGTFKINKAALTVKAENKTITYGDMKPTYTVTYTGFKMSDDTSVLGGNLSFACDYAQYSDINDYVITPSGYTSDNYDITYETGTLKVLPKAITVTIDPKSSIYGDGIQSLSATVNGIVNNDENVYSLSSEVTNTSSIGTYDITGSALDDNYDITFKNEKDAYTITKRELTINVEVADKQYDGKVDATITSASLVNVANRDAVELVNGTATFTNVNVGNDINIAFSEFSLSGEEAVLNNYTLIQPTGVKANITNDWNPQVNREYTISQSNENGWLNKDLVVSAKEGYQVSLTNTAEGSWSDTLTGSNEGADSEINFYVKNVETGAISLQAIVQYKLDKNSEATTTSGKVFLDERNSWEELLNTITFDLFFKDEVVVKAEATDALSGVASIEYYESSKSMNLEALQAVDTWKEMPAEGKAVALEDTKQFIYYVRISDNAGNITYLSSNGAEYDTTLPTIEGVENGSTYYTTQNVTVTDKNIESITLNDETASGNVTLQGNVEKTYTIVASDKAGNSTTVTVTMKPISTISEPIDDKNTNNVKSDDKDTVDTVLDQAKELLEDTDATDEEVAQLEDIKTKAEDLINKIEEVAEKIKDSTDTINGYDPDTVKSSDKDTVQEALDQTNELLDGDNLTDDERTGLEETKKKAEDLVNKINEIAEKIKDATDTINGHHQDTVKSSDKEAVQEALDQTSELLDGENLTDEERSDLEEIKNKAEDLLDKIDEVAKEIKDVTDKINGYDPDKVTSNDKDAIQETLDQINDLLNGDNLTEEERKSVEEIKKKAEDLLNKINEIADKIKDAIDTINGYDPDSVKSSDNDKIQETSDKIDELLNSDNLTDEERKSLEETKKKAEELQEKIKEVADQIKDVTDTINEYDPDTVKSSDKDKLEETVDQINDLLNGDNLTDEERKSIEEIKQKAEDLLNKIDEIAEKIKDSKDTINEYDPDTVKSSDKDKIQETLDQINELLDGENLTDEERTSLEESKKKAEDLLDKIDEVAKEIKEVTDGINGYNKDSVTSDDIDAIQQLIDRINELLDSDNLTDEERSALEEIKQKAEDLLDQIDDAKQAVEGESIDIADSITVDNVTREDKDDLENALNQLEQALIDYDGNYTEDEKQEIQVMIDSIDEIMNIISNVEKVEDIINNLPDIEGLVIDNEENLKALEDVMNAYEALTDYEKGLVDATAKEQLDAFAEAMVNYQIIEGNGSTWTKGSKEGLTFVANGAFRKFTGIVIDDQEVDEANYEAKSGSTIIALTSDYLNELTVGKHTITVRYEDGEAKGTFNIIEKEEEPQAEEPKDDPKDDENVKPAKPEKEKPTSTAPTTGDTTNIYLWMMLLVMTGGCIVSILYKKIRNK